MTLPADHPLSHVAKHLWKVRKHLLAAKTAGCAGYEDDLDLLAEQVEDLVMQLGAVVTRIAGKKLDDDALPKDVGSPEPGGQPESDERSAFGDFFSRYFARRDVGRR